MAYTKADVIRNNVLGRFKKPNVFAIEQVKDLPPFRWAVVRSFRVQSDMLAPVGWERVALCKSYTQAKMIRAAFNRRIHQDRVDRQMERFHWYRGRWRDGT